MANVPEALKKTGDWIKDATLDQSHLAPGTQIPSDKLAAFSENRDAGGNKIVNMADGSANDDAATVGQVNNLIAAAMEGASWKDAHAASTANISGTYNSTGGAAANGQLTGMPNAVDGHSLAVDQVVLLKDQSSADQNGAWKVVTLGTGSNGVWERADDFNSDAEARGATIFVIEFGSTNAGARYICSTPNTFTLGTASGDALTFSAMQADYTAGAGLELNGTQFAVTDGGIVEAKIGSGAVTADKIGADAVKAAKVDFVAEVPGGTKNGANQSFTLTKAPHATKCFMFWRGSILRPGIDFSISGTTITMTAAPDAEDDLFFWGFAS